MARRIPRADRAAYRRDDTCMARIREATTWRTKLQAGVDYLKAALDTTDPDTAMKEADEAAMTLADAARRLTFGEPQ